MTLPGFVCFDLDGVLVDSRPGIEHCINGALRSLGLSAASDAEIRAVVGPPLQAGFATLLGSRRASLEMVGECVRVYRRLYADAAVSGTTLHRGVPAMLGALACHPLAVATSKPLRFAEPILRALGIRDAFEVVAGPTEATDGESKTQTLRRALDALRERSGPRLRRHALMVGDRSHDIVAALDAGIAPVGATWGFGSEDELLGAGAAYLAHEPATVPRIVAAVQAAG